MQYTVELDRTLSLNRVVPELFSGKYASVLYIGARDTRMDYLQDFLDADYDITILEVFPKNVETLRDADFNVIQGDCREYKPADGEKYDVVFWWHGPEHIQQKQLAPTLELIESYTKYMVVLGCPHGDFPQGEIDGNKFETHLTAVVPSMLPGGYHYETLGDEDQRGSNITAVKYIYEKLPRDIIWITEGAIDFLEHYLDDNMMAFEFGAGASTLWLAERVAHLTSVEHDPTWHDRVVHTIRDSGKTNVVHVDHVRPYADAINIFEDREFDFILVDGRDRVECVLAAIPKLKRGGVLMLDNSEREQYIPALKKMKGYSTDKQIKPDSEGFTYPGWQTSWYIK